MVESFCSKRTPSASPLALFSILRNKRRTLILSNAEGDASAVLSPNRIGPAPGKETTGLTAEVYRSSLAALLGLNASLTTFLKPPLLVPAGEIQSSLIADVETHKPATSPLQPM